jgi:transcriptional regulator with XRE-family HTH domain
MQQTIKTHLRRFGGNVRRIRNARGLTQAKLSEMTDWNIRTV